MLRMLLLLLLLILLPGSAYGQCTTFDETKYVAALVYLSNSACCGLLTHTAGVTGALLLLLLFCRSTSPRISATVLREQLSNRNDTMALDFTELGCLTRLLPRQASSECSP
jgi:hypothetical protein